MKRFALGLTGIFIAALVQADDLEDVQEMICAAAQVQICVENDTCYLATPAELGVPDFVVIDIDRKTISTTKASKQNRSTVFSSVGKEAGLIYLQGMEGGRAFSFVIDEATGRMTVAVSRDGLSISVFGACTDTNF
ncbi:MAG: hypothetical protein ACI9R7_001371 [Lysobacterales bacterium]|jgi:hypothetical protein